MNLANTCTLHVARWDIFLVLKYVQLGVKGHWAGYCKSETENKKGGRVKDGRARGGEQGRST